MEKMRPYIKNNPDNSPSCAYIKWSVATEQKPYIKNPRQINRPYIKSNLDGTPSRWYIKASKPENRVYIRWSKKKNDEKQAA